MHSVSVQLIRVEQKQHMAVFLLFCFLTIPATVISVLFLLYLVLAKGSWWSLNTLFLGTLFVPLPPYFQSPTVPSGNRHAGIIRLRMVLTLFYILAKWLFLQWKGTTFLLYRASPGPVFLSFTESCSSLHCTNTSYQANWITLDCLLISLWNN